MFLHHRREGQGLGQQSTERPWRVQAQCGPKCTAGRHEVRQDDKRQKGRPPKALWEQQIQGPHLIPALAHWLCPDAVPGEQALRLRPPVMGAYCVPPSKGRAGLARSCLCCLPGPAPPCRPTPPTGDQSARPGFQERFLNAQWSRQASPYSSRCFSSKPASMAFLTASRARSSHHCSAQSHLLSNRLARSL